MAISSNNLPRHLIRSNSASGNVILLALSEAHLLSTGTSVSVCTHAANDGGQLLSHLRWAPRLSPFHSRPGVISPVALAPEFIVGMSKISYDSHVTIGRYEPMSIFISIISKIISLSLLQIISSSCTRSTVEGWKEN